MRTPSLAEFKRWSKDHYQIAHAVCLATAFAEIERERVDAYIKPVFDRYEFYVKREWSKSDQPERITTPKDLYLSDQDELCAQYYEECDREHRKHGFDGPHGHSPALIAENLQIEAENALIKEGQKFLGIEDLFIALEHRKKMLDLLLGACLKKEAA